MYYSIFEHLSTVISDGWIVSCIMYNVSYCNEATHLWTDGQKDRQTDIKTICTLPASSFLPSSPPSSILKRPRTLIISKHLDIVIIIDVPR